MTNEERPPSKDPDASVTPSMFSDIYPWNSQVGETWREIVAQNIMKVLKRTGDKFRSLSWKEYKEERLKDGNFSKTEEQYFEDVQFYTIDEKSARSFCKGWLEA